VTYRLPQFLEKTIIGKVGPDKIEDEIRRITRYEEWCNLVEDSESEDDEVVSLVLYMRIGYLFIVISMVLF
jgi:hypothetical protein